MNELYAIYTHAKNDQYKCNTKKRSQHQQGECLNRCTEENVKLKALMHLLSNM